MSALYAMRYLGQTGVGIGVVYVGRGTIVGADAGNGRYNGTYASDATGRLKGNVTLTMASAGVLVTGQQVPAGTKIPLTIDWPATFANGQAQAVTVGGRQVQVAFEKLGDIP